MTLQAVRLVSTKGQRAVLYYGLKRLPQSRDHIEQRLARHDSVTELFSMFCATLIAESIDSLLDVLDCFELLREADIKFLRSGACALLQEISEDFHALVGHSQTSARQWGINHLIGFPLE